MPSLGRFRPSCRYLATQAAIVLLLLLAAFQVLQLKGSTFATDAPSTGSTNFRGGVHFSSRFPLNKEEKDATNPLLKNYGQLGLSTAKNHVSNKLIFKGRPNTPAPSPRTPISPVFQPTPDHVTRPMRPPHFFNHDVVKTTEEILVNPWVTELRSLLAKSQAKQVSIVFSSSDYLESLLNWLIAAEIQTSPPIDNIIVFCLDRDVFDVLNLKDVPSIYVDPKTVANTTQKFSHRYSFIVWVVRFVVFRLINYYGYDVVSYDSDAIVLKNPQKLFDKHLYSDIVSSAGSYPFKLGRRWGFTVCLGVVLFRSTPKTELLWESINTKSFDDQVMVNYALDSCGIQWQEVGESIQNHSIDGQCLNGLRVSVLSQSDICRRECNSKGNRSGFYVWHQLSKKTGSDKVKMAQEGRVWFLRRNWRELTFGSGLDRENVTVGSNLLGNEWLASLSVSVS